MSGAAPLLYINCAGARPEIGLFAEGAVRTCRALASAADDPRGLELFKGIAALLTDTALTWHDLEAVAVGCGPGMLTGTRVGIAAAQALASGAGLKLVALSEFFGYADPAVRTPQVVHVPLGRLGVATATVTVAATGWRWTAPRLLPPDPALAPRRDATALAAAAAVAPRVAAAAAAPIYLRDPDVRPQADAMGRPLAATP